VRAATLLRCNIGVGAEIFSIAENQTPTSRIGSAIEPADIGHAGAPLDRRKTAGSPSIVLPLRTLRGISRRKIKVLEETDAKAAERG
jgi:hypothetical protein